MPQTANWDLVGGVSFKKGCYPGQEIVARMQYLGRLKERLYRLRVGADPLGGAGVAYWRARWRCFAVRIAWSVPVQP